LPALWQYFFSHECKILLLVYYSFIIIFHLYIVFNHEDIEFYLKVKGL
jgi:hypothetical protein